LIDFQTVLDAERSVLSFQDQLAQSKGQITSDVISLYQALGGGWTAMTGMPPSAPVNGFIKTLVSQLKMRAYRNKTP